MVDKGAGPWAAFRINPELDLLKGLGASIEPNDVTEDVEPRRCDLVVGCKRLPGPVSCCSSGLMLRRLLAASSSLSLTRRSCSYNAPTCARYGLNSAASTMGIFVSVTGGISRAVGALWELDDGAVVCG